MICGAWVQISHLNYGMGLIDAVKYLPIYNASLIMNSTFAGLIFYQVPGASID